MTNPKFSRKVVEKLQNVFQFYHFRSDIGEKRRLKLRHISTYAAEKGGKGGDALRLRPCHIEKIRESLSVYASCR